MDGDIEKDLKVTLTYENAYRLRKGANQLMQVGPMSTYQDQTLD